MTKTHANLLGFYLEKITLTRGRLDDIEKMVTSSSDRKLIHNMCIAGFKLISKDLYNEDAAEEPEDDPDDLVDLEDDEEHEDEE